MGAETPIWAVTLPPSDASNPKGQFLYDNTHIELGAKVSLNEHDFLHHILMCCIEVTVVGLEGDVVPTVINLKYSNIYLNSDFADFQAKAASCRHGRSSGCAHSRGRQWIDS